MIDGKKLRKNRSAPHRDTAYFLPFGEVDKTDSVMARKKTQPAAEQPARHVASTLYCITGLGALATAVGMMLCGKRNGAMLVAQWVAPLLITAAHEQAVRRKKRTCTR